MVGQDEIQLGTTNSKQKGADRSDREVAAYVLKMLNELATMADMSGHIKLASDIEGVLGEHDSEAY